MSTVELVLGLLVGLALGALAVWLLMRRTVECQRSELSANAVELARMQERAANADRVQATLDQAKCDIDKLNEATRSAAEERARLITQIEERERAVQEIRDLLKQADQEKQEILATTEKQMREAFASLSQDALAKSNERFLELASEHLAGQQKQAKGELELRKQAIDELVKPLADGLQKVGHSIADFEKKRIEDYTGIDKIVGSLKERQISLEQETRNLVNALRQPQSRGQWGEIQLKRVVELAGMLEYCDFHQQVHSSYEDNRIRPDLVVRLPGKKNIIVDSKAVLTSYLSVVDADSENVREDAQRTLARHLRDHVKTLASKKYSTAFDNSPEMVVLFVPLESILASALQVDAELVEYSTQHNVLLATPITLIGLLRALASAWRHEALEQNARIIAQEGKVLYERVSVLTNHLVKMGKQLDKTVESYNDFVGSMERNLLPSARKIATLAAVEVVELELPAVTQSARQAQAKELVPKLELELEELPEPQLELD